MTKTFQEVCELAQYFKDLGAVKFTVSDTEVSVDFGPAPIRVPTGPGLLDDPASFEESKLEFIKQNLKAANEAADEIENWST